MVHISQDSVLVGIGVIGSGSLLAFIHQKTHMATGGVTGMWIKILLGGLMLYLGQMEDQDFLSLIGFGILVSGIDEYLVNTGQVASAGETATTIANKIKDKIFSFDEKVDLNILDHTIQGEIAASIA